MFPLLYHLHHSGYIEDLSFWLNLAAVQGGPILELGCGTGRVLVHLAQGGYLVYGIDRDPEMLAFLQKALPAALNPMVHLIRADMAAFHLARKFPLILLPCNTFSALPREARRSMLDRARQHLLPGGLFVASLPNPVQLFSLPEQGEAEVEDIFLHPASGNPLLVSSAWERNRQYFKVKWYYDHLLPDGQVDRITAEFNHELLSTETYFEEFNASGFSVTKTYGDYSRLPYHKKSPHLILVAQPA